ncbi:hypothetical protein FOXG_22232 [Fusarium oxysporum f. sp. lycopersici 4287]|uniref:Uncharacterized protein n=2 Tax=Fusarium oxysporum TaxID=5507 RepID=A0A0J9WUV3_FUSO4|nr:hypothetical protein FOXG_22232 [Fusarium oxysporum f. sp. lycopersici 4287]EXK26406.1 hypothetical protein FOMG_17019 [Fusarium oxysporum f. sp. melonis 26406]KNB18432.1 hypothetical protein FOXG_22232 [Fusarium oxysporum f. sp. lycopersici 4287]
MQLPNHSGQEIPVSRLHLPRASLPLHGEFLLRRYTALLRGEGPWTSFGDDQLDVIDGVVYMIEECPASGPYFGKKCLYIAITTAAAATISDTHL